MDTDVEVDIDIDFRYGCFYQLGVRIKGFEAPFKGFGIDVWQV